MTDQPLVLPNRTRRHVLAQDDGQEHEQGTADGCDAQRCSRCEPAKGW